MIHISDEKLRQLVNICNYYYFDGLSQKEIAEKMGTSRPQISRMLNLARASGIVNITINDPFSEERKMEQILMATFGLAGACIVSTGSNDAKEGIQPLTAAVSGILNSSVKRKSTLGIMAGTTLNSISQTIGCQPFKDLTVVPLVGGCGSTGNWQANLNARNFGEQMRCKYLQLNAPMLVASPETKTALMREPEIRHVLNQGRHCTIALIGIGQMQRNATIINAGFFSAEDLTELHSKGACASICNSFLDEHGAVIPFSGYDRMVGLTAEDLREIPKVVGIAAGADKVAAITATLLGRWIDVLVTSLDTARQIMEYYGRRAGSIS